MKILEKNILYSIEDKTRRLILKEQSESCLKIKTNELDAAAEDSGIVGGVQETVAGKDRMVDENIRGRGLIRYKYR